MGYYHFDTKAFIVTPWHENFQIEKVDKVLVRMRFLELALKYWSHTSLSKLASLLGVPIMADKSTIQ